MTDTIPRKRLPGSVRREAILSAALDLFARRSYDAVGMRDVAAACNLSATGIYRHLPSKEALLIGLFDRLSDQLTAGMRDASRAGAPRQVLAALVRFHVGLALREPAMIPIYQREESILPPQERRRFRQVLRDYLAMWCDTLRQVVPEVSDAEARTTVVAAFGTMNCIAYHRSKLGVRALERLLIELAGRTLGVDVAEEPAPAPMSAHR